MLLQLSQCFSLCPSLLRNPKNSLRQSPHLCSCPWAMYVSSLATPFPVLYFTPPWLFCNYIFVLLNPFTSLPNPLHPPPSWPPSKRLCNHDFVPVLVCLVFLKKYFIVILLQWFLFPPFSLLHPAYHPLPQSIPTLLSMSMGHSYMYLIVPSPSFYPYPPPFWLLSVCYLLPCL